MSFDKKDRTNAVLEARQLKRNAQQIARVESEQKRKAIESLPKEKNDYTNVEDETEEQPSTSSETKRKHRREIKTGSTAFWPHNVLQNQSVVQEAIRNKISVTSLTNITRVFIRVTNGDEQKVNLSYTQAYRYREDAVKSISVQIKAEWESSPTLALHWDGKLMSTLEGTGQEERLPILVSGKCGVKLLGVPVVQSKKGDKDKVGPKIADASVDLLIDWDCAEKVKSMVFDTTALNTGSITAACVSVQERLNKKLLWLPCRHHIGERILLHVFKSLDIEDTSGPRSPMFSKFQQNFKLFKHTKITLLSFPVIPPSLKQARNTTVKLCQDFLACKHNRGDYRELVVITLVYLKKTPHEFKKFQRPGAHNHTRWMCKLLYSFKMVLLSAQIQKLPQGSHFGNSPARTQLVKLTSFIQFVVFCYVPWWITASHAPSALVSCE